MRYHTYSLEAAARLANCTLVTIQDSDLGNGASERGEYLGGCGMFLKPRPLSKGGIGTRYQVVKRRLLALLGSLGTSENLDVTWKRVNAGI